MTREEAITVLKGMKRALKERDFRSEHDALNMAIEALSAPQTDLISRADVFEIIDKAFSQPMRKGVTLYAEICLMLNTLPTHANSRSTHERDLISRSDAIEAFDRGRLYHKSGIEEIINSLPSADAVPKLKQTDTLIIADALRYLAEDTERHPSDRKRAEILRGQILSYGAKMSADAVQGWRTGKPKKQGEYIVTVKSMRGGMVELLYYGKPLMPNRKVKGMCWYRSDDEWGDVVYDDADILAWMPLPKPYKGGDSE